MFHILSLLLLLIPEIMLSQTANSLTPHYKSAMTGIIEIRSYNLKPASSTQFHEIVTEKVIPLLKKWKIKVLAYGPSLHDNDSYYLIRSFMNLKDMEISQNGFYNSNEWKAGPKDSILFLILNFSTIVLPEESNEILPNYIADDSLQEQGEIAELSSINALFIKNFLTQDVKAHDEIIHEDFVCIESNGAIIDRETYIKNWATDFSNSGYTSFGYSEEFIRIFGNVALVRAKTRYTKQVDGKAKEGFTIYTDTYIKDNCKWQCGQVQITPVK